MLPARELQILPCLLRVQWAVQCLLCMTLCIHIGGMAGALQPRQKEDANDSLTAENDGGNGTSSEPALSANAIANITASSVAVFLIGAMLCYLWQCFDRRQRMQRVRMALERNKQIERQMAAAKARQKQRLEEEEGRQVGAGGLIGGQGREALLFSAVHRSHELPRESGSLNAEQQPLLVSSPGRSVTQISTSESVSTSTDSQVLQVGKDTALVTVVQPGQVLTEAVNS